MKKGKERMNRVWNCVRVWGKRERVKAEMEREMEMMSGSIFS